MAKQHKIPIGKKKIAKQIPQQSKSSCSTPTRQFGQFPPTTITDVDKFVAGIYTGCWTPLWMNSIS